MEERDILLNEKRECDYNYQNEIVKLSSLKVNIGLIRTIISGWLLLPFLGASIGALIGEGIGLVNREYKVTSVTYNMETGKTITDDNTIYESGYYTEKINI